MNRAVICFVIWGDGYIKEKWLEWYQDVIDIMKRIGYENTHIGIISKSFKNGKILTVSRKGEEIISKLSEGEIPESMSCYTLPENFSCAAFDYEFLCIRYKSYIYIEIYETDYSKIDDNIITSFMKKYITFERGEIYKGKRLDNPVVYTVTNSEQNFASYELVKKIDET